MWEVAGGRQDPAIVFEHPGAATIPTSIFLCQPGGMVVICAGTTGFDAMVDLRYHWTRQKRFQGSHGTNDAQAYAYNDLVRNGQIDPALGRVLAFTEKRSPSGGLPGQKNSHWSRHPAGGNGRPGCRSSRSSTPCSTRNTRR
jgi:NADPH:quinone reductase-like Zn-dependent oxidoreductase